MMPTVRRSYLAAAAVAVVVLGLLLFRTPWLAGVAGSDASSPSVVSCEPNQQALVRQMRVNGELQVAVSCVSNQPSSRTVSYAARSYAPAAAPAATRAARTESAVTRTGAQEGSTRSWKTTALVIGGSTGAGAGVGGAIGGKKGALIGAAIGGGSAAIFEAIKRKDR
jgi:hypothetical protein